RGKFLRSHAATGSRSKSKRAARCRQFGSTSSRYLTSCPIRQRKKDVRGLEARQCLAGCEAAGELGTQFEAKKSSVTPTGKGGSEQRLHPPLRSGSLEFHHLGHCLSPNRCFEG